MPPPVKTNSVSYAAIASRSASVQNTSTQPTNTSIKSRKRKNLSTDELASALPQKIAKVIKSGENENKEQLFKTLKDHLEFKCRSLTEAKDVLKMLKKRGFQPDTSLYNSAIIGREKQKDFQGALELFEQLKNEKDNGPDLSSYITAMHCYAKLESRDGDYISILIEAAITEVQKSLR